VRVICVDEHVWRHTRRGDKYVTVIIHLTGTRDGTGPARLLDMVEGRSKQMFKTWFAARELGAGRAGYFESVAPLRAALQDALGNDPPRRQAPTNGTLGRGQRNASLPEARPVVRRLRSCG